MPVSLEAPGAPRLDDAANTFAWIPPKEYEAGAGKNAIKKRDAQRILRGLLEKYPVTVRIHRIAGIVDQARDDLINDVVAQVIRCLARCQPVRVNARRTRSQLYVIFDQPVCFAADAAQMLAVSQRLEQQRAAGTGRRYDKQWACQRFRQDLPSAPIPMGWAMCSGCGNSSAICVFEAAALQEFYQGRDLRQIMSPSTN